jgi:hypothetical protein
MKNCKCNSETCTGECSCQEPLNEEIATVLQKTAAVKQLKEMVDFHKALIVKMEDDILILRGKTEDDRVDINNLARELFLSYGEKKESVYQLQGTSMTIIIKEEKLEQKQD